MCGRYYIEPDEEDLQIRKVLEIVQKHYPGRCRTGEINPGDTAPGIINSGGRIVPVPAVFGFPTAAFSQGGSFEQHGRLLVNARSETVTQKKTFAAGFRDRRIILPASGFFEWSMQPDHTKYYLQLPKKNVQYLCGLYQVMAGVCRFVILTTAASESLEEIHERMPVIVGAEQVRSYLTDYEAACDLIRRDGVLLEKTAVLR